MNTLTFTTQGIDVGFGEEGFTASGQTDNHSWNAREYGDGPVPKLERVLTWVINTSPRSQWDQYIYYLTPDRITPRAEALKAFWKECGQPQGRLQRHNWDGQTQVSITYSLPANPSLVPFVLAALQTGRELLVRCGGFVFVEEDRIAPAPSMEAFDSRLEPAFTLDHPMLSVI